MSVPPRPIDVMSVSLYERLLRCPLQVALGRRREEAGAVNGPPSGNAALGLLVHRAFELSFDGCPDFDEAWKRARAEPQFVGVRFESMPSWRRIRLRANKRHKQLLDLIERHGGGSPRPEVPVQSVDGKISGRIDLLIEGAESFVVDYKTGIVLDGEGELKLSSRRQLQVYSFLLGESTGISTTFGYIVTMKANPIRVEIDAEESRRVALDMVRAMDEFNGCLPNGNPARPDSETCGWCSHTHECPDLRAAVSADISIRPGGRDIAWGTISAPPTVSASGLGAVRVRPETGSVQHEFTLFAVPDYAHHGLSEGSRVLVRGLMPITGDGARKWVNGVTQLHGI